MISICDIICQVFEKFKIVILKTLFSIFSGIQQLIIVKIFVNIQYRGLKAEKLREYHEITDIAAIFLLYPVLQDIADLNVLARLFSLALVVKT